MGPCKYFKRCNRNKTHIPVGLEEDTVSSGRDPGEEPQEEPREEPQEGRLLREEPVQTGELTHWRSGKGQSWLRA